MSTQQSKTPWTPGPWPLETVPTSCGVCHKIGAFPKTPEKTTGACVYVDYNAHAEEMLANARLISKAPELAYLLQAIINDLPSNKDWLDPDIERSARGLLQQIQEGK